MGNNMLTSLDALSEGFLDISKKSRKKCGDELEELRRLTFLAGYFLHTYVAYQKRNEAGCSALANSLRHACFLELIRISGHVVFLSCNGLYRNAFDDIRYALESIVQALYIDNEHSEAPFSAKMEILKEIEGKREYRAQSLIDKLKLGEHQTKLQVEYKELSKIVHPSHRHVETFLKDFKTKEQGVPTAISCEEISNICESLKRMYDIFLFLVVSNHTELIELLKKNPKFTKSVEAYGLPLLSRVLTSER
jgi:hypothetical protein